MTIIVLEKLFLWCLLITDPYQCKHGKHNNQPEMYKMGEITWKKFANPSHDPYKIYFTSNRYICIACILYIVNLSFYNAITWLQRNVLLFSSDFYTNAFSSSHTLWTRNCNQKTVYNDHLSSSKSRYTYYNQERRTVISQE